MNLKKYDQYKKFLLDFVRELPIGKFEDIVKRSGDPMAHYLLRVTDELCNKINNERNQKIAHNFGILFAMMSLDGAYSDQIHYVLNSIKYGNLNNIPCKSPQNWRINKQEVENGG